MNTLRKISFWGFFAAVAVAVLPVLSVLLASALSSLMGSDCVVNEGFSSGCRLLGFDFSNLLYMLFVSGWFALVTLPLGGLVAAASLTVYIVTRIIMFFRNKKGESVPTSNQ